MLKSIKKIFGNIINYVGEIISRLFNSIRSLFRLNVDNAQNELNESISEKNTLIEMPKMTPPNSKDIIVSAIVDTVEMGMTIFRFVNVFSNYLIRFATDRKTSNAVKKYIRMDRYKRLDKMNSMLLEESFSIAGLKIHETTIAALSKVLTVLYDQVLDDYKPLNELMDELFTEIEETNDNLMRVDCINRKCHDIHIVMKTSKRNKLNIIRFGRATNLDLSTYASNKNFAKIAVISQLEFCNMFAVKSITIVDYDIKMIISHTDFTVKKTGLCEGIFISLHNKMIVKQFVLQGEKNYKEDNKVNCNSIVKVSPSLKLQNNNHRRGVEVTLEMFKKEMSMNYINMKVSDKLYNDMYNAIYGQLKNKTDETENGITFNDALD